MKKIVFLVVLAMTVCVSGMLAQNVENPDTLSVSAVTDGETASAYEGRLSSQNSQKPVVTKAKDNFDNATISLQQFKDLLEANQTSGTSENDANILVPIGKKNPKWFFTHHIGFSILGGSDSDTEKDEIPASFNQEETADKSEDNENKTNIGINGDYTISFIRGRMENGQIKLNPLGFAINTGILAAFDRQDVYGMTCDLMLKFGFETGFGHKMGIGIDFLAGTGKSNGAFYYLIDKSEEGKEATSDNQEIEVEPYTAWCFKKGFQIWFRSGLLRAGNGNNDVKLFVRYIFSKDPHKTTDFSAYAYYQSWFEESWQVGLTYCF